MFLYSNIHSNVTIPFSLSYSYAISLFDYPPNSNISTNTSTLPATMASFIAESPDRKFLIQFLYTRSFRIIPHGIIVQPSTMTLLTARRSRDFLQLENVSAIRTKKGHIEMQPYLEKISVIQILHLKVHLTLLRHLQV